MSKTRSVRLGLIVFLTLLAGALLVGATALPSRAVPPELFKNVSQTSALSLGPVKLQARGGVIILNPFAGPSSSPVTANGQNWGARELVVINLLVEGQEYTVASAVADDDGSFETSFFIPLSLTQQPFVTVLARAVGTGATAIALYTITDNVPVPVPTPAPAAPQGVVIAESLNVRSGPGAAYPIVGRVGSGQVVDISGVNGDWWRISFVHALGDYGWVSRSYISAKNAENVPVIQAPPPPAPTPAPTPTPVPPLAFQCNPGQWSGCGGASCLPEYVSQCGSDGKWQQCVWDPGHCSTYNDNNNNNNNNTNNDNNNNNNDNNNTNNDNNNNNNN